MLHSAKSKKTKGSPKGRTDYTMNKERRKTLDKAHSLILEAQELIAGARDDEQDAFYNLPDSLQSSERGEQMDEYISTLDDTECTLDDILSNLMEIIEG